MMPRRALFLPLALIALTSLSTGCYRWHGGLYGCGPCGGAAYGPALPIGFGGPVGLPVGSPGCSSCMSSPVSGTPVSYSPYAAATPQPASVFSGQPTQMVPPQISKDPPMR